MLWNRFNALLECRLQATQRPDLSGLGAPASGASTGLSQNQKRTFKEPCIFLDYFPCVALQDIGPDLGGNLMQFGLLLIPWIPLHLPKVCPHRPFARLSTGRILYRRFPSKFTVVNKCDNKNSFGNSQNITSPRFNSCVRPKSISALEGLSRAYWKSLKLVKTPFQDLFLLSHFTPIEWSILMESSPRPEITENLATSPCKALKGIIR